VLGLLLIVGLVASGSDRDPTETALPAPASSSSAQPTSAPSTPAPKFVRVPAVKGLALVKAKRKLRAAGLEVGGIDRRPSSKRKNTVLKQGVAEGKELKLGSSVALVVAAPLPRVPSSRQAGNLGDQESQKCWLHGEEDNPDQDHRSGWGRTQSVTLRRNTGEADVRRWHCDFERAT
jgi:hypothetical protein